ncbi:cupin domain-containing protein [Novosphingobium malaysiense]|uniref:Cupin 2 conserved barrel domain-containing protein n=1 Tax=Novosphingobium malaysiense TaxID=1348853 RepID=A0A0B1ZQB4_9SPHN|nr:hypothetical protein [Novosphingobium malaysiense]KHK91443.1 hypothetical protein LK12_11420 [Novosphingobium malaysiense]
MSDNETQRPRFEIFRGADAPTLEECGCMTYEGDAPNLAAMQPRFAEATQARGEYNDVPYRRPGMSLARLWFKSGFPLPLHTHDCECLYYIVAGSVRMGSETLGAGDGFYVGADVPYSYTAGPEGVEILEFRNTDSFNIKVKDKPVEAWEKTVEVMRDASSRWDGENPPVRKMPEKV